MHSFENPTTPEQKSQPDVWSTMRTIAQNLSMSQEEVTRLLGDAHLKHKFKKVDSGSKNAKDKKTLAHLAAETGNVYCVKWLDPFFRAGQLEYFFNEQDCNKDTALMCAIKGKKSKEVITALLYGRSISHAERELQCAIDEGNQEALSALSDYRLETYWLHIWYQINDYTRIGQPFNFLAKSNVRDETKASMAESLTLSYGKAQHYKPSKTGRCSYDEYMFHIRDAIKTLLAKKDLKTINVLLSTANICLSDSESAKRNLNTRLLYIISSIFDAFNKYDYVLDDRYAVLKSLLKPLSGVNVMPLATAIKTLLDERPEWQGLRQEIFTKAINLNDVQMLVLLSKQSDIFGATLVKKPELILQVLCAEHSDSEIPWKMDLLPFAEKAVTGKSGSDLLCQQLARQIDQIRVQDNASRDMGQLEELTQKLTTQVQETQTILEDTQRNLSLVSALRHQGSTHAESKDSKADPKAKDYFTLTHEQYSQKLDGIKQQILLLARIANITPAELQSAVSREQKSEVQTVPKATEDQDDLANYFLSEKDITQPTQPAALPEEGSKVSTHLFFQPANGVQNKVSHSSYEAPEWHEKGKDKAGDTTAKPQSEQRVSDIPTLF